jgi:hypothetical protein
MRRGFSFDYRSCPRSPRIIIALAMLVVCASLAALRSAANADESIAAAQPMVITLAPIPSELMWSRLGAEVAYVDLLPDGRIAVLGGKPRGPDGYLRLIDIKTGQEIYYYVPNTDGFGGDDDGWADVAVLQDAVFIYFGGGWLRRGTIDAHSATGSSVFPNEGIELHPTGASVGAMVADGNSVLVGWGGLTDSDQGDDCGTGPVVARLSSDGRELWRWQDTAEKFAFPNDIAVLADGTILVLVEGYPKGPAGVGWNFCPNDREYLVALAPDGREIGRLDLPGDMSPFPLVLSRDGTEVLATDNAPDGNLSAILHIHMEADRILMESVDVAGKVPDVRNHRALVTDLDGGGYRLIIFPGDVATLDSDNNVLGRSLPKIDRHRCSIASHRGLVCWDKDKVTIVPLR